jgi:uncharacterized protein YjbJ (UPF0337 family)
MQSEVKSPPCKLSTNTVAWCENPDKNVDKSSLLICCGVLFLRITEVLQERHAGTALAHIFIYYHSQRRSLMNWNQIEGKWEQVKGKVKEQWGKLTDDDLTVIKGKRDQLRGKLQERYGYEKDKAEREIDDWSRRADF